MHHGRVGGHPGPRHLLRHRVAHLQRRDHLQVRDAINVREMVGEYRSEDFALFSIQHC